MTKSYIGIPACWIYRLYVHLLRCLACFGTDPATRGCRSRGAKMKEFKSSGTKSGSKRLPAGGRRIRTLGPSRETVAIAERSRHGRRKADLETVKDLCGTGSSNPASSSSETGANLSLAGIRLPMSPRTTSISGRSAPPLTTSGGPASIAC
jgi:hypothetical protein